ncbi:MAG TPA: DUF488 domain-containing protein [Verrucomicrobiae bacterium]|nr:DUF488 domain-containing protein [Verrucomicrobiae bacterium]
MTNRVSRKLPRLILTIGHSTHPLDEFIALLRAHGVKQLADVRTIPRSRHNPQFNRDTLSAKLRNARIGYRHMKGLGGLRHPLKDSPNAAWRNSGSRGFADYMQTDEFAEHLQKLIELAQKKSTVIMCAEAVPWRCHRLLISDALTVRGIAVEHITSRTNRHAHQLTPFAQVHGHHILYPSDSTPDLPTLLGTPPQRDES